MSTIPEIATAAKEEVERIKAEERARISAKLSTLDPMKHRPPDPTDESFDGGFYSAITLARAILEPDEETL